MHFLCKVFFLEKQNLMFWTLKLLSSVCCQSRADPGCAGSLRALILKVIPENHLQKLQCAERGRSSLSAPLLKSHSLWGLGKHAQPWQFLFPGVLGEKPSFPAGKGGKAPQKLCIPEEDQGPGMQSSMHGLCLILSFDPRLSQPWHSPSPLLSSFGSFHLFFAPLQPETHFCAHGAPSCQPQLCASGYPLKTKYSHAISSVF